VPPQILIAEPEDFSASALARLRQVADVTLQAWPVAELPAALGAFDVFWFRLGYRLDADTLAHADRCRVVATPVTGLDHIDLEAAERFGVRVISLRGEHEFLQEVRATAELTIGLTIALLRHLPAATNDVLAGNWNRDAFRGRELYRKTAGVVGVGRLGLIVAGYFRALGMTVLGYDPTFPGADGIEMVESLPELFSRSDVVSIHARFDSTTRHLVDARMLAEAKPGAVLINTARGGLVDEGALLEALGSGRLAGAALDVVDDEHLITSDHPLVQYARSSDNLLLVPHIGGNTIESFDKTERFVAERVIEVLRGGGVESGGHLRLNSEGT
jgi:D-3-phosphoglycerate dehydrogenase